MNRLINSLKQLDIEITDEQVVKFERYFELLVSWNEKMNLTSITEKSEVIDKHFIDSVMLYKYSNIDNAKIIDIGTGAGFPGIPLKIMCPSCKITLLDSLAKRITFLNEVINELELTDIITIHGRAEDFAHDKKYREKYDFATSRAVANLSTLSEYCIPFVKENGKFVPYKSGNIDDELVNAKKALSTLGGKVEEVKKFMLPDTDFDRSLVYIKKIKRTPNTFPRKAGTPSKQPL